MFATLMYRLTGVVLVIMITTIHAVITTVNEAPLTLFESFADMVMVFVVATVLLATQDSLDHDDDTDYSTAAATMCTAHTPTPLDLLLITKPQVSSSDSIVSISDESLTFSDVSCSAVSLSNDDEDVEADSFSFSSDDDDDDSLLLSPEPSSPPSPRPVFTRYGRQVKRPVRFMFDAEPKSTSSPPPSPSPVAKNLFPSPVSAPSNSSAVSAQPSPPQPLPPVVPVIVKPINRVRFVEGIETEPPLLKPTGSILRRPSYGESPVDCGLLVMQQYDACIVDYWERKFCNVGPTNVTQLDVLFIQDNHCWRLKMYNDQAKSMPPLDYLDWVTLRNNLDSNLETMRAQARRY